MTQSFALLFHLLAHSSSILKHNFTVVLNELKHLSKTISSKGSKLPAWWASTILSWNGFRCLLSSLRWHMQGCNSLNPDFLALFKFLHIKKKIIKKN